MKNPQAPTREEIHQLLDRVLKYTARRVKELKDANTESHIIEVVESDYHNLASLRIYLDKILATPAASNPTSYIYNFLEYMNRYGWSQHQYVCNDSEKYSGYFSIGNKPPVCFIIYNNEESFHKNVEKASNIMNS